jgi:eukaryotic-like serine/threonine-protein kinase
LTRRHFFIGVAVAAIAVTATLVALAMQVLTNEFVLIGRDGTRTVLGPAPISAFAPRVSPDGKRVLFGVSGGALETVDIPSSGAPKRVAALPDANFAIWDATGERIFYIAAPDRNQALFFTRADGSGFPQRPLRDPARAPDSSSSALNGLSFITLTGADYDIWFYSEADRKAIPLIVIEGSRQLSSQISPDGRWVAYKSDESGSFEIWVQPFPAGPRTRVTRSGGSNPLWSKDGRELFFDDDHRIYSVAVATEPTLSFGLPRALPITGFVQAGSLRRQWDLMPDGRFLVMVR